MISSLDKNSSHQGCSNNINDQGSQCEHGRDCRSETGAQCKETCEEGEHCKGDCDEEEGEHEAGGVVEERFLCYKVQWDVAGAKVVCRREGVCCCCGWTVYVFTAGSGSADSPERPLSVAYC